MRQSNTGLAGRVFENFFFIATMDLIIFVLIMFSPGRGRPGGDRRLGENPRQRIFVQDLRCSFDRALFCDAGLQVP